MPGLVATSSSTDSAPFGPKPSGCGSRTTSSRAPSIASSASSSATRSPSRSAAARRPLRQLRGEPAAHRLGRGDPGPQLLGGLLGVLEPRDLRPAALGVREHRLDRAAVLSLQPIEGRRGAPRPPPGGRARRRSARGTSAARRRRRRARARRRAAAPPARRARGRPRPPRSVRHRPRRALPRAPPPSSSAPLTAPRARAAAVRRPSALRSSARSAASSASSAASGAAASISESSKRIRSRSRSRLPSRSSSSSSSRPSAVACVRGAVLAAQLELIRAGEPVEDLELGRGQRQLAVLVLAVEGEQARAERPQVGGRGRASADERAGPPGGADSPPEHDLVRVVRQPLGDLGQLRIVEQSGR